MYENLYDYSETINGIYVSIQFKPNFREEITAVTNNYQLEVERGEITLKERFRQYNRNVCVSEEAQWVLVNYTDLQAYELFVTERTQNINTSLGEEWNKEFNRLLKKCKEQYAQEKKEEIRLYFYDSITNRVRLCHIDMWYSITETIYSLDRPFVPYCDIDKKYPKPEKDCFILGRVQKTIGTKNSKLMDFIQPVHKLELDFEPEGLFGDSEVGALERILFKLLRKAIQKDECTVVKEKIWKVFKEGNVQKLRKIYEEIYA